MGMSKIRQIQIFNSGVVSDTEICSYIVITKICLPEAKQCIKIQETIVRKKRKNVATYISCSIAVNEEEI